MVENAWTLKVGIVAYSYDQTAQIGILRELLAQKLQFLLIVVHHTDIEASDWIWQLWDYFEQFAKIFILLVKK